ncbi:MAG: FkbM family methyltransferase [Cyanosarcina radialis HA8281-LM2]|jgi:FkbM family methyltransferase|nr:FkbM family methyltransferase [Cyanosarcina radialis HA8281-LM2]
MIDNSVSQSRNSMLGALANIKNLGFQPNTVIDVGAALGTFDLYTTFPEAKHFLIEPIVENEPYLGKICQQLENAEYIIAGATRKQKEVTLTVSPYLIHSSVSDNSATEEASSYIRTIPGITLDQICIDKKLEPPYLIKIDVDGNEVDVLRGAVETLKDTEYVITEVTLFGQISEVITFMKGQGFVPYDIVDIAYRPIDNALWQCDMAFVKEGSQFRANSDYINKGQLESLAAHLNSYRQTLINYIDSSYFNFTQSTIINRLNLREINLIVFPEWNQLEELLSKNLSDVISAIASHPDKNRMTLLIDRTNISEEDANMFLSSIAMNLMMAEELDVSEGPEISLVGQLSEIQWQALLPKLQGRIVLENEDREAIASAKAENLTICNPTNLDEVITNNCSSSEDDYRSQVELKGYQFTQDWFSWNIPVWQQYLQRFVGQPNLNVLEIGSWEGRSTCWLLEHVLTHESAKITCVDTFEGSFEHTNVFQFDSNYLQSIQERFDFNVGQTGMPDKVQKMVGRSSEIVRSLPFNSYDIAYIDGSHIASDVLQDAVLVWSLVKVGGYIIFDDYPFTYPEKPFWNTRIAVDAFVQIFQDKLNVLHVGHQAIVEKLES